MKCIHFPPVSELKSWFLTDGYIWDWTLAVFLIVFNQIVPVYIVKPVQWHMIDGDPTISYPSVPSSPLLTETNKYLLVFLLPVLICSIYQYWHRSWVDWHHFLLTYAEGFAILTTFKKWMNLVGRPRPDWFSRVAKGEAVAIEEGVLSYPSGHAVELFFSMLILSLYFLGKIRFFVTNKAGQFPVACLALVPLAFATFISMMRIYTYRHHPSDVNAGMALGILVGGFSYLLNYPSLFHQHCDQPRLRDSTVARWSGRKEYLPLTQEDTIE